MAKRQNTVAAAQILDPDHEGIDAEIVSSVEDNGTEVEKAESLGTVITVPGVETMTVEPDGPVFKIPPKFVNAVEIKLPLIEVLESDPAYISCRVETRLSPRQARALRGLFLGLHELHQKTTNGQHVDNANDALRWLLDQVADVVEASRSDS